MKLTTKQNEVLWLIMQGFLLLRSQEMRQFCLSKQLTNYYVDSRIIFNLLPDNKNIINEHRGDYFIREDFDKKNIRTPKSITLEIF